MTTPTSQSQPAVPDQQPPGSRAPGPTGVGDNQPHPGNSWVPRRQTLNVVIDVSALLAAGALAGSGLILAYRLPPGRGNHDLSILGWGRHDWGDLHLILAWVVIGLMVVHLLLHVSWLMHACATIAGRCGVRMGMWLLPVGILLVTGALIAVPCLLPIHGAGISQVADPQVQDQQTPATGQTEPPDQHAAGAERAIRLNDGRMIEIRGGSQLSEIVDATGMDGTKLRLAIGVAADCPGIRSMKEIANDLGVGVSELRSRIQAALAGAGTN